MSRIALSAVLLALTGCYQGNRGLETVHQPVVRSDAAYVPNCPDWRDGVFQPSESQGSNFGCATMANLAAMVADPEDLLHGKSVDASSAETAGKAIKAWREMEPTSKLWVTTVKEAAPGAGK